MKKILSAIVVAALGWVAFDRVAWALKLRGEADAVYAAARDVDALQAAATVARKAYAEASAAIDKGDASTDALNAYVDAAYGSAKAAFYAAEAETAFYALPAAHDAARKATDTASYAVQLFIGFAAAVVGYLNRKTPSA